MKFKNIESVFPISEYTNIAEINCHHENLKKREHLHETFFIDKNCNIIAKFKNIEPFYVEPLSKNRNDVFVSNKIELNHNTIVKMENSENYAIINSYENMEYGIEDGTFAVKKDGLWGYINEEGIEIIKPQYDDYCSFFCGVAAVRKNGKWGFINKQNDIVIPFEYEISEYSSFNDEYAPVGKNNKFGFVDRSGSIAISFKYESAMSVFPNSKIFPVKLNNKWGFIDINEKIIIPFEYDSIEIDGNGYPYYSIIKSGNYAEKDTTFDTYGLVDARSGNIIIPCCYNLLSPNKNSICVGIITKEKEEKYALVDYKNNNITGFKYDRMYDYSSDGLYEIRINRKWGYVNEQGELVVNCKYFRVEHFKGGYAVVEDENYLKSVINKKGETIIQPSKNDIFNLGAGMFLVEKPDFSEYELIKF